MVEIKLKDFLTLSPTAMLFRGDLTDSIVSVSTDSRSIKEGDFYLPLRGASFDGHDFIAEALKKGASGFFFDTLTQEVDSILKEFKGRITALAVTDGLKALHLLAHLVRKELNCRVIGITGSSGKTTTKDMLTSILKRKHNVLATKDNLNNEVGLPLTILRANQHTEIMVLEMGMRGRGQIAELCEVANPDVGIVTNIGQAHYALLGSEKAIAEAKSELIKFIDKRGAVIINEDDQWTPHLKTLTKAKLMTYGFSSRADVYGELVSTTNSHGLKLRIRQNSASVDVDMPLSGKHNAYNALAAATAALWLGVGLMDIKKGLESFTHPKMRMEVKNLEEGIIIINDAYNANPDSMKSAIEALKDFPNTARKIAVLGDMAELGEISDASHLAIGAIVKENGIDILIAVGKEAALIAKGAKEAGMDEGQVFHCSTLEMAKKVIKKVTKVGDVILFKASRAMKLEGLVEYLS